MRCHDDDSSRGDELVYSVQILTDVTVNDENGEEDGEVGKFIGKDSGLGCIFVGGTYFGVARKTWRRQPFHKICRETSPFFLVCCSL